MEGEPVTGNVTVGVLWVVKLGLAAGCMVKWQQFLVPLGRFHKIGNRCLFDQAHLFALGSFQDGNGAMLGVVLLLVFDIGDDIGQAFPIKGERAIFFLPLEEGGRGLALVQLG
jgi:hypothetical protein